MTRIEHTYVNVRKKKIKRTGKQPLVLKLGLCKVRAGLGLDH